MVDCSDGSCKNQLDANQARRGSDSNKQQGQGPRDGTGQGKGTQARKRLQDGGKQNGKV